MQQPKKVTVQAAQQHTYEGKEYDIGQQYEADEAHLDTLAVQGKAVRAKPAEGTGKRAKAAKARKPAKGTYSRRDMRASKKK